MRPGLSKVLAISGPLAFSVVGFDLQMDQSHEHVVCPTCVAFPVC